MPALRKCDNFCPQGIREIVGQEYPVKGLVKELMKDRMFYEQSGGGVTLSGGEVMAMSTDYILQIAKDLKKKKFRLPLTPADMFRMINLKQFYRM